MARRIERFALASLALALALLCAGVSPRTAAVDAPEAPWLDSLGVELGRAGLRQRTDVAIEINEREVARGFSRPGCDGLLLVAALPRTAQGWRHVAPRLDLSAFSVRYAYAGTLHERLPRFARLRDRLLGELTGAALPGARPVVALAERGQCDLTRAAVPALRTPASAAAALPAHAITLPALQEGSS